MNYTVSLTKEELTLIVTSLDLGVKHICNTVSNSQVSAPMLVDNLPRLSQIMDLLNNLDKQIGQS